jgi:Glycosyl hydrolases family 28
MSGGVRNVEVYDCVLRGTDDGVKFKTVRGRGGVVENINIHDLQMYDIGNMCIGMDMYYMLRRPTTRRGERMAATQLDDADPVVAKPLVVTQEPLQPVNAGTPQIRNITIRNVTCQWSNIAMQLRGLPELPLKNVTIENAQIVSKQGGAIIDADGITLRNVHIQCAAVPTFQIQDATNLTMQNVDSVPQGLKWPQSAQSNP